MAINNKGGKKRERWIGTNKFQTIKFSLDELLLLQHRLQMFFCICHFRWFMVTKMYNFNLSFDES